jgi:hypothetical protein
MWPFKPKTLEQHLLGAKKVKVHGVTFVIRKIDAMDHLAGLNVLQKIYDVYKVNKGGDKTAVSTDATVEHIKKIRGYCRDILLAGVAVPKLSATENGDGFYVEKLFADFDLAQKLTEEILVHTFKKKLRVKSNSTAQG